VPAVVAAVVVVELEQPEVVVPMVTAVGLGEHMLVVEVLEVGEQ
jgi:hypothetical protein